MGRLDFCVSFPYFFVYLCRNNRELKMKLSHIFAALAMLLLSGCGSASKNDYNTDIVVSIEPLKFLVESIVGEDLAVKVLVPSGSSPETYEPTPKDLTALHDAKIVFSTGVIEFENILLDKLGDKSNIVGLDKDIDLIKSECSHHHDGRSHSHGVDPHVWTSPKELRMMARNMHTAIMQHYPDSTKYNNAYLALDSLLYNLDIECCARINSSSKKAFIIYHPALTYYARHYGLTQIAIEDNGKEPSAKYIAQVIESARQNNITKLLYQIEFPRSVVEVIANDMGVEPIQINPLSANPVQFIKDVTHIITQE